MFQMNSVRNTMKIKFTIAVYLIHGLYLDEVTEVTKRDVNEEY